MAKKIYLSLKIAGLAFVTASLCGVGYYAYCVWLLGRYTGGCVQQSRIIARSAQGLAVELTQDFCAGPAFSSPSALGLVTDDHVSPIYFFRYQGTGADPVVTWMNRGAILVRVRGIQETYARKSAISGIRIEYDVDGMR